MDDFVLINSAINVRIGEILNRNLKIVMKTRQMGKADQTLNVCME